jgi:ubiquinone/menaquinone biosynthesis C-methylase UbiE
VVSDDNLLAFYGTGSFERDRLSAGRGKLEFVRIQELLRRFLPGPPLRVLDVGGGPGNHANWLTEDGYDVKLIDVTPEMVQQARQQAGEPPGFEATVGDARDLAEPDESADAVLLLGPLYHLPAPDDRMKALAEAHRVLRPGGFLAAAAISRYTFLLDLLRARQAEQATLTELTDVLADGQLLKSETFTTAYFHQPHELRDELLAAGLTEVQVLAIEGPGWVHFKTAGRREGTPGTPDDPDLLAQAVAVARLVETEPSLLGASAHILGLASRPDDNSAGPLPP